MNKIRHLKYNVVLSAPIGNKTGIMTTEISENEITGVLSIMKNDNCFSGTIDERGNCRITGVLKTLLRVVSYEGCGYISDKNVSLMIRAGKLRLTMTGKPISEGGGIN